MHVQVLVRALALAVVLGLPEGSAAQPESPAAPPADVPPHLMRLEGAGAEVARDGTSSPARAGRSGALRRSARQRAGLRPGPVGRRQPHRPRSRDAHRGPRCRPAGRHGRPRAGDHARGRLGPAAGRHPRRLAPAVARRRVPRRARRRCHDPRRGARPRRRADRHGRAGRARPDSSSRCATASRPRPHAGSTRRATTASPSGPARHRRRLRPALRSRPSRIRASRPTPTSSTAMARGRPTRSSAPCGSRRSARTGGRMRTATGSRMAPRASGSGSDAIPGAGPPITSAAGVPTRAAGGTGCRDASGRQPGWTGAWGPGYIGWTPLGGQGPAAGGLERLLAAPWRPRRVGRSIPSRAWTVIPSDHFGQRGRLGAYAVDPRTLDNLSAFVTQRTRSARAVRHAARRHVRLRGRQCRRPTVAPAARRCTVRAATTAGVNRRTGGGPTATPGGAIGPTRVGPPAPGYGGPTPPADDPYERAQRPSLREAGSARREPRILRGTAGAGALGVRSRAPAHAVARESGRRAAPGRPRERATPSTGGTRKSAASTAGRRATATGPRHAAPPARGRPRDGHQPRDGRRRHGRQ